MKLFIQPAAFIFASLLATTSVHSQTLYNIIDLGDLPGGSDLSAAWGINDSNQIAGWSFSTDGQRPVLWDNGAIIDLGLLPNGLNRGTASSINNAGNIVGFSQTTTGTHATLWYNGAIIDLGDLPGDTYSSATGINNSLQIAGYSSSSLATHAFLWENGALTNLGDLPGGNIKSISSAINNKTQIVGFSETATGLHAFLWQNGVMTDLGELPGGIDQSIATDINDNSEVVGYSETTGMINAFIWKDNVMKALPVLAGYTRSLAFGINNYGSVVGATTPPATNNSQAFIYDTKNGIVNLNSLIDPADPLFGQFTLAQANKINNTGSIAGYGHNGTTQRAFLLVPIDYDEDGVKDVLDQCKNTKAGSVINANGCSIAQLVPCKGPYGTNMNWENHGSYVDAVEKVTEVFLESRLILESDKDVYINNAKNSICGI
ncbi:MAG: DUF3466 family protein [Thiohalomonadales bacterium]